MDGTMARLTVAGIAILMVATLNADVVIKNNGGRLEGEVLSDESDFQHIVIQTKFGKIQLPRSEVKDIEFSAAPDVDYNARAEAAKETPADQYSLALWCLENNFKEQYQKHLERVIELDPNHEEARKRLGFVLRDGKWLTKDEVMAADGYVKYRGKWMLPQEREQAEKKRADQVRRGELAKVIRVAQRWLRQDDKDRQAQARADLLAIHDPVAVPLLMNMLAKKGTDQERRLLVDVLEGVEGPESTQALLELAMGDDQPANRRAAIEAVAPRKTVPLVHQVAKELTSNDNDRVNRAGAILAEIGDSSIVGALVDAVVTTHKTIIEPTFLDRLETMGSHKRRMTETVILPDGTMIRRNLLAGRTGNDILTPDDPQTRVIVEEKKNPEVVAALEKLTGKTFGFDENAWRIWLDTEYRKRAALAK